MSGFEDDPFNNDPLQEAFKEGEKAAEARIVAWLREQVGGDNLSEFELCVRATWLALSDMIERGEHRERK